MWFEAVLWVAAVFLGLIALGFFWLVVNALLKVREDRRGHVDSYSCGCLRCAQKRRK